MAFEIRPIKGDFVGEVRGVDPGLEVRRRDASGARGCMVSAFDSGVPQPRDVSRPAHSVHAPARQAPHHGTPRIQLGRSPRSPRRLERADRAAPARPAWRRHGLPHRRGGQSYPERRLVPLRTEDSTRRGRHAVLGSYMPPTLHFPMIRSARSRGNERDSAASHYTTSTTRIYRPSPRTRSAIAPTYCTRSSAGTRTRAAPLSSSVGGRATSKGSRAKKARISFITCRSSRIAPSSSTGTDGARATGCYGTTGARSNCATPFDESRYVRHMYRTTLDGETPVMASDPPFE